MSSIYYYCRDVCDWSDTAVPAGESKMIKQLVAECHTLVTEFSLDFSKDKVLPKEFNRKGELITQRQMPYSKLAGTDMRA